MSMETCLIKDGSTGEAAIALLTVALMLFERWLGRTKRIKQNSTIDLIASIVVAIGVALVTRMMRRKDGRDGGIDKGV